MNTSTPNSALRGRHPRNRGWRASRRPARRGPSSSSAHPESRCAGSACRDRNLHASAVPQLVPKCGSGNASSPFHSPPQAALQRSSSRGCKKKLRRVELLNAADHMLAPSTTLTFWPPERDLSKKPLFSEFRIQSIKNICKEKTAQIHPSLECSFRTSRLS